ncbi:hypothetical protein NG831_16480 [Xanthomonas sacchari]|uniref:hypothetical protein n=1 Tax=Xanthomonas sacchari TaxID=56458 RepID=UPI00224DCDE1|nr:hypothetical protein [Xanthomonas sacchari]UYK65763.1 hypothetical protein NG831_16480 [Xanthomonas sacchari]
MTQLLNLTLGALLALMSATFLDWKKRRREKKEAAGHLGVIVLMQLNRLIAQCAAVAGDDGTAYGRPAGRMESGEEYYMPQTENPVLELDQLKVEWRSISPNTMYAIHRIPAQLAEIESLLSFEADQEGPPYDIWISLRQEKYAGLGIAVAALSEQLRSETNLPEVTDRQWKPEEFLEERYTALLKRREEQEERQSALIAELSPPPPITTSNS